MDTLVAQYSGRPQFESEGQDELQQQELYGPAPGLSLKFAMPPVAQVRSPLPTLPSASSSHEVDAKC